MPSFKAAYLIHGDDHGRIAERRTRLRALAEAASGTAGVEVFENDGCTPEAIVGALSAMTFAIGRRFVIADGVERWKDAEAEQVAVALTGIDPESLTVAFFAREEGRFKVPASLLKAVEAIGGAIAEESQVKPRELPKWLGQRGSELGIQVDNQAARALIAQVGDRQQRLLRELEKLALEYGPGAPIGVEEVEASCASSAERKVWTLADAVVAGDRKTATRVFVELRQQGERVPGLLYNMVRRLRDALAIAEALNAGQPPAQIKKGLRMPGFAADRLIADAGKRDVEAFRRALVLMADLEAETRGHNGNELDESTVAVRAVVGAAS
ncbi:MAG TPA: DNA polymerase III subunit delta [Solirubrobacteraceae bacterium]|nr:DNA polymerase III subunit delta [Solirubrobacteraceae bacterium]